MGQNVVLKLGLFRTMAVFLGKELLPLTQGVIYLFVQLLLLLLLFYQCCMYHVLLFQQSAKSLGVFIVTVKT